MREKDIEKYLCKLVSERGGLAIKQARTGVAGFPDRLILTPSGKAFFVELKATGEKPRKLQLHRITQLKNLKFDVYVVDSYDKAREVVENEF